MVRKRLLGITVLGLGAALLILCWSIRSSSPSEGDRGEGERVQVTSRSIPPSEDHDPSQAPAARDLPSSGAGLRARRGERPGVESRSKDIPPELLPVVGSDPKLAVLVSDQWAMRNLWQDLNSLLELKSSLSADPYREMVMRETFQFLGLEGEAARAFEAGVLQALGELDSGQKTMREGITALPVDLGDASREERTREILERYQLQKRSSLARVGQLLDQTDRSKKFREHLEMWLCYLAPL
jgi:hypothetical protein